MEPPPKAHRSTLRSSQTSELKTEDMTFEVLLRLPTKSLMRFKCVSKLWYSIIRNPEFAEALSRHGGRKVFRGLLITDLVYGDDPRPPTFYYANPNDTCPINMSLPFKIHQLRPEGHRTQVVRGLIGFYSKFCEDKDFTFTLCNIATREIVKLPLPPPPPPSGRGIHAYFYYLGFDPINEVYKVLAQSSWLFLKPEDKGQFFAFGVHNSNTEWKSVARPPIDLIYSRIDHVPEHEPERCLCIDGSLYWLINDEGGQALLKFHLNRETFETITIPEVPLPPEGSYLVEICARPGIVVIDRTTQYAQSFDVWTMNTPCTQGDLGGWTKMNVLFPMGFDKYLSSDTLYAGTFPSGEIMLAPTCVYMEAKFLPEMFPLPICVYDRHSNETSSITIAGYKHQYDKISFNVHRIRISYYEENIISLSDCLKNNQEKDETTINN